MSTLRVTNLQSAAGTQNVTQDRLYRGAATAWVNFNGTGTVAIRDSYNVSSITDIGVGFYTVNFQTALANANYAPTINAFPDTAGLSNFGAGSIRGTNNKTSSGFTFATVNYNDSAFADFQEVDIHVFGGY